MVEKEEKEEEKRLPYGISNPKPGSRNFTPTKLQAFNVGVQRKNAFERHKEEAEAKRKREAEEAAKVYESFVESFEDDSGASKAFVKGETILPKAVFDRGAGPPVRSSMTKAQIYKPMPFVKSSTVLNAPNDSDQASTMSERKSDKEEANVPKRDTKPKGKRNLDTFLEEIKREQEEREIRTKQQKQTKVSILGEDPDDESEQLIPRATISKTIPFSSAPSLPPPPPTFQGSFDTGDPATTNLYVGNLNPKITEDQMCRIFGAYGPIGSVKIMWPRNQEEKDRNRNCGFISFMKRADAEMAIKNLDAKEIEGYQISVGWGKAVPLPPKPIYDPHAVSAPTGLPFNAQIVEPKSSGISLGKAQRPRAEVRVTIPLDHRQLVVIHRTIERVLAYGPHFESAIMAREKENPLFRFLYENETPEHVYYRWKLYSMMQGDRPHQWRVEPFQMFDEGPIWIPPDIPFNEEGDQEADVDSDDDEDDEREVVPKGVLGPKAKSRLTLLLRGMTSLRRGNVAKAMVFAIDHADAAEDVASLVCASLTLSETPIVVKVARLFLVSDILHNSGLQIKNAWKFRKVFEERLLPVFEHLNVIYRGIDGRLKAEQFRRHVYNVLKAWENWLIFPQHYIASLEAAFMKKGGQGSGGDSDTGLAQTFDKYGTNFEGMAVKSGAVFRLAGA